MPHLILLLDSTRAIWANSSYRYWWVFGDTVNFILRVDGVNLGQNVFATNDISTIRGTSLTYEAAAQQMSNLLASVAPDLQFETIFAGASQTAFLIRDTTEADVQAAEDALLSELGTPTPLKYLLPEFDQDLPPFDPKKLPEIPTQHVTFAAGHALVGTGKDARDAALAVAQSNLRFSQMTRRSIKPPEIFDMTALGISQHADAICPIDQARPLGPDDNSNIAVRVGQYQNAHTIRTLPNDSEDIRVSKRVADVRRFGQTARYQFYSKMFRDHGVAAPPDLSKVSFAQSFEELVESPPKAIRRDKVGVTNPTDDDLVELPISLQNKIAYLYFDGTGWGAAAQTLGISKFSQMGHKLFVGHLLHELVAKHTRERSNLRYAIEKWDTHRGEDLPKLRFETLMMGGEDWCLTVPAWNAFSLVECLLKLVDDSFAPLKLRCGVLICSYKTPVRQARKLAYEICEKARLRGENSAQFHIIESIEVPDHGIDVQRQRLYGTSSGAHFTFSAADLAACRRDIARFKDSLPRSQIYKSISAIDNRDLTLTAALENVRLLGRHSDDWWRALPKAGVDGSLPLKLLADYWDYADPFNELVVP